MSGSDGEEFKRKLRQAETSCKQERELQQRMLGHGLALEELMKETKAENKCLTSKVKKLQQQVADIRKSRKEEDEEALRQELLSEEERTKSQSIHIRKMEKENQKLREKNKDMTAQLDQLSVGEKYQEEIQNLKRVDQALKHSLEEVQEVLRLKDEEIEMKSVTLIKKDKDIEEYFNTIEYLRQDQQELREQLSSRQEEQTLAAMNFQESSETRQPLGSAATDEDDEEHKDKRLLKMENQQSRAKGLWKGVQVAGDIALCVLLPVGIMAFMVPMCYSQHPDLNLWNIAFDLLEPYSELHHTLPPVY